MAYVDRNAQINKNLEFLMNYLMRTGIMGREFQNQRTLNEQESENRMKYLERSQEGYTGLENLRSKNTMIESAGKSALSRGEEEAKHGQGMTRMMEAFKNDVSKLPPIQALQAQIARRLLDGEDPATLRPLQDQMTTIIRNHSTSILNSLKGELSPKDISETLSLSVSMGSALFNDAGQAMRQNKEIEEVKKPEMGLRAGELGVSQAKQDLAERTFAAEGGTIGRKLTDIEKTWISEIDKSQAFVTGQWQAGNSGNIKVGGIDDSGLASQAIYLLGRIRNKILEGKGLTADDKIFINSSRDVDRINATKTLNYPPSEEFLPRTPALGLPAKTIGATTAPTLPAPVQTVGTGNLPTPLGNGNWLGTTPVPKSNSVNPILAMMLARPAYKKTATNASTGQVIGSDDGINWYDIRTGQVVK
jgi:hypothetical protein